MNKNTLKNFAINSRLELLARVRDRATLYGITDEKVKNNQIVASNAFQKIDGQLLSKNETAQRNALLQRIQNNGYVQVMEEVAYTWFNRFIAIKYMEVHKLLPVDQRVIPQQAGELPQLVREGQNVTLENIDFDTVAQLLDNNKTEELYKYLVIALCNQLSGYLPQMFEKISDYTELLFPDGLMKSESFLGMLADVDDENWQEIQAIGWLYQYYNTDLKNETFELLKKNVKITKDRIGAATQLFTPEWIVRYMVENSLGRLWYEGHPDDNLKSKWRYYLDEAQQEPEVEKQLSEIRKEREKLQPEEIKLIDPCMGSGHILVYAFDVLMDIYRSVGYTDRDAVQSIIQNNIFGLDIDDRAAQLAYFALMMKAAEYDKRFLKRKIQPNVCAMQESNSLVEFNQLKGQMSLDTICFSLANQLISSFSDAKEYGSILMPHIDNLSTVNALMERLECLSTSDLEISAWYEQAKELIPQLAKQAIILQQKYHIVLTNPPYMSAAGMSEKLIKMVKTVFPDSKGDLFAVFMERIVPMLENNGFQSMITQHAWMFLTSFERLREKLQSINTVNMIHLGAHAFEEIGGEVVQTTAFILCNHHFERYNGTYVRLLDASSQSEKESMFLSGGKRYVSQQQTFARIPGMPIVYWANENVFKAFQSSLLGDCFFAGHGLLTGHDEDMIYFWHEIDYTKIGFNFSSAAEMHSTTMKYAPATKGGDFRKWYGNLLYVAKYDVNTIEYMKRFPKFTPQNEDRYFKEGVSWNNITTRMLTPTYLPPGCIFNNKMPAVFTNSHDELLKVCGFMASKVCDYFTWLINPSVSCSAGVIRKIPVLSFDKWNIDLPEQNIKMSKEEWDSFETSWSFQMHPLIRNKVQYRFYKTNDSGSFDEPISYSLEDTFDLWKQECEYRFMKIKNNEEKLNRLFIDIYGLGEDLIPEVNDRDVTVRTADIGRDVRSLISYAVGCMFGRYSLDVPGLAYAGGEWNSSKYVTYPTDKDNILPITDDQYFQDDIVSMFVQWIKTVYGEETLEENLQFIANALNPNGGNSREVIRSYFLNDFYSDHLKIYQKRPIYWQFDSGKQNGFKALMYLHRYDQDTVARLRTDYVHELQDRYRTQLEDARKTSESGDARQRSAANKRAQKLDKQLTELNKYEELVHHYADMRISLDLDDGVKMNYAKLQDILTKIK